MLEFVRAENNPLHIDNIYKVLQECGQDMYKTKGLTHWLRPYPKDRIKEDIKTKFVFVVYNDNEFVATFTLIVSDRDICICKLAVSPGSSGKGIGKKCMQYIEEFARVRNINILKLDVYDKSARAISFYEKLGFIVTGQKPTTNFTVLLMEKHLEVKNV